jgi:predicted metal-binding membrane protein
VIASAEPQASAAAGLGPALAAARARLWLIALLIALAAAGWWWTSVQMQGMDDGPWTGLGTLGWFTGVWIVMMGAMMFPSVAPTVALYSRMTRRRSGVLPLLFAAGYLVPWAGAGLVAFGVAAAVGTGPGDVLSWDEAGRWIAGATLLAAAVYELTPLKDACLSKCRSPLGFLLGTWRDGPRGAVMMGAKHGAWCVGCCWALMASLFALGVMSVFWMAVVAALIAVEKTIPWRDVATRGTAALLTCLAVLLLAAPSAVPGLTIPSGNMTMGGMDSGHKPMGGMGSGHKPMAPMKPAAPMQPMAP